MRWFKAKKKKSKDTQFDHQSDHQDNICNVAVASDKKKSAPMSNAYLNDVFPEVDSVEKLNVGKKGLFNKLRKGLFKTRKIFSGDLEGLFKGKNYIDDNVLERLEELLITSDVGVYTAMDLIEKVSFRKSSIFSAEDLKYVLKKEIFEYFTVENQPSKYDFAPIVVMVVGVNGVGKTSTIGKLAALESMDKKKVLIAAADTFRAAAVKQLTIYAKQSGTDVIKHRDNADPAAVAYDGVSAAISRGVDKLFIDTAGRLHTKTNLMEELKKIKRTIAGKLPGAPHEVLLVLDATTGQNAFSQAEKFNDSLGVTGIVLTKLDGGAKGGVVINISRGLDIPIKYIGVGECMRDLQTFDPKRFIDAMF